MHLYLKYLRKFWKQKLYKTLHILGTGRKKAETEDEKYEPNKSKYPLRPPCACKDKCSDKVPQRRRIPIWCEFWKNSYNDRKAIIWRLIERQPTKSLQPTSARAWCVKYYITLEDATNVEVCQHFSWALWDMLRLAQLSRSSWKQPQICCHQLQTKEGNQFHDCPTYQRGDQLRPIVCFLVFHQFVCAFLVDKRS